MVCNIVFVSAIHLYFIILLTSVASMVSFLLWFILAMYLCSFFFLVRSLPVLLISQSGFVLLIFLCFFHSVSLPLLVLSLCLCLFLPFYLFFSLTLYRYILFFYWLMLFSFFCLLWILFTLLFLMPYFESPVYWFCTFLFFLYKHLKL